jgi:TonB family protein
MSFQDIATPALSYALQSGFLLAIGLMAPRLLRVQHPKTLLAYWRMLLLVVLFAPAVTVIWQPSAALPMITIEAVAVETVVANALPSGMAGFDWTLLFVPMGAVTLIALVRLSAGLVYLDRSRRTAIPLEPRPKRVEAVQRVLRLDVPFAVTNRLSVPVTFGWARPIVLVPSSFHRLSADEQEGVACHELLHVHRNDWPMTILEEVVRALLWFHPAVWVLLAKITVSREQVVDAGAVAITGKRRQYLDALWQIVCSCQSGPKALAVPLIGGSHLRARVEKLKKETRMSTPRMVASMLVLAGVLAAAGAVGAVAFSASAAALPDSTNMASGSSADKDKQRSADDQLKTTDSDCECEEITHPVVIEKTNPKYPDDARREKVMGVVIVETVITEEGLVDAVEVLRSPDERLSEAAIAAVKDWRFDPALCDGKPVGVYYVLTIKFNLE